jgi:hypothetical protein
VTDEMSPLPLLLRSSRSAWLRPLVAAALGLCLVSTLGATSMGCASQNCDTSPENNPPAEFRGGILYEDDQVYETSTPSGLHLNFGAGARYRIYHGLSGRPAVVQIWVSFSSTGVTGGNEAMPAGNMAEVVGMTDEYVEVRNDSCGEYWLRVVMADPVGTGKVLGPGDDASAPTSTSIDPDAR